MSLAHCARFRDAEGGLPDHLLLGAFTGPEARTNGKAGDVTIAALSDAPYLTAQTQFDVDEDGNIVISRIMGQHFSADCHRAAVPGRWPRAAMATKEGNIFPYTNPEITALADGGAARSRIAPIHDGEPAFLFTEDDTGITGTPGR
ncbi:hypothetical protein [Mangrovicoccus ximenensis]|uniref:hypothetical protein n=1 Tax=Mangrovicoccus ximenensis TaxID=1911570 RepID=UPI0038B363B0